MCNGSRNRREWVSGVLVQQRYVQGRDIEIKDQWQKELIRRSQK